jgi:hypothetical protein
MILNTPAHVQMLGHSIVIAKLERKPCAPMPRPVIDGVGGVFEPFKEI